VTVNTDKNAILCYPVQNERLRTQPDLSSLMKFPPFPAGSPVAVVVPSRFDALSDAERHSLENIPRILHEARAGLERELGATIDIVTEAPPQGSRWLIGPARCNPALAALREKSPDIPELVLNRDERLLITDAMTPEGVWETFSLLRSLARMPGNITLQVRDCANIDEAIQRIDDEVGDSYPSFGLRGLDWNAICERHIPHVRNAADPFAAMQRWLAELHDGHTWVRPVPPLTDLPYELWLSESTATFARIPADSAAYRAGVRPGFRLIDDSISAWWQRTAASPHSRSLVSGRRLLQGTAGTLREFTAASPDGKRITWSERIPSRLWENPAEWQILPSGAGYLKIHAWVDAAKMEAIIDEAFAAFRDAPGLIVDLRGCPGGDLSLAHQFRNRFLREPGIMGTIRYSTGHNELTPHEPITGEPAPPEKRWSKNVRFLTDPLTYSAAEDAMLGLQGLSHVQVIGEPSGGGSGRLRVLRLFPGWRLTISTALTYDRNGHCIEGSGIPVDLPVQMERFKPDAIDVVLRAADTSW
jgi:carboxyl-terminal processing protease